MIKNFSRLLRAGAALLTLSACLAIAQDKSDDDAGTASVRKLWHVTYDVDKDGRTTTETTIRTQVAQESAVEYMKTYSISYSTSIEKGEILEAYTLKKDGKKVVVPAGNYQVHTNDGRGGANPFFSDRSSVTVVFPDLSVGDAIQVRYRITEKEPMFPGQFSLQHRFSPFSVDEDVRVTVRTPRELPLRHEEHHVAFSETEKSGIRVLEWRYSNLKAREQGDDDNGIWSFKEVPSLFVSTFSSYEAIAKAYGERALPKAAPTDRIRELAKSIIGNESNEREKARKLYEWVSRNITYGGNCIGVGAVVPRDVDVVLDNRMGDCKDHATLLQALLAAASIKSEQVLINAGGEYDLPDVPVVSMVNHVMNYLPAWSMYVDATAKEIPFGYLPRGSYAKPVLHLERDKAFARIPDSEHTEDRQVLDMSIKIAENGSAKGSMHVKVHGTAAASTRSYMRELKGQAERDFVKSVLASAGYRGRGTVERGNVEGLGDEFEFDIKFDVDNYLKTKTGSFYLAPIMSTPLQVMNFAGFEDKPASKREQVCWGFHSVERMEIEFPPGLDLIAMPSDMEMKGSLVEFRAKYSRDGDRLNVTRALDDKSPGGICSSQQYAEFVKQAIPVGEHLRTQVLYKRK